MRKGVSIGVLAFFLIALLLLFLSFFLSGWHFKSRNEAKNLAFWMQHSWMTAERGSFTELSERLKKLPIDALYFHVGPLSPEGKLAEDLDIFSPGLKALGTTNYAWMGQIRSQIDLDNSAVRAGVLESADWILDQGFDGIHLNVEPVREDDEGFFDLVRELRAAQPEALISITMDEWQPHLLSKALSWVIDVPIESYWTTNQYKSYLPYVDEVVVMTYDTNFDSPKLYAWWVEQQSIHLSRNTENSTSLRIGIPSYEQGAAINPEAENLETGLRGFKNALTNIRTKRNNISGPAIYSYWEMDESEWKILEEFVNN